MKYLLPLILVSLFSTNISAQNSDRIAPLSIDLDKIYLLEMENLNNKALYKQEMRLRKNNRPNHFAHTFRIDKSTEEIGKWTTLADGSIVWRLRIHSDKAMSLNLGFSKYKMPSGGRLVIYTPDTKKIIGPFTPADNEDHEQLWTPIIDGDDIIVEVWLKENNRSNFELELKSVNHDFIGINSAAFQSGSCNLDVLCDESDGWGIINQYRDIIQSVALTQLNGNLNCTGFLVNNTAEDCTPLFMTAHHCMLTAENAPTLVTYWNYENSTCRQPNSPESGDEGDGSFDDFNSGSVLRGSWVTSDFTIVELDDPVSLSANGYRAGWNASPILEADTVIGIHHPSRDEKRISFEYDPVVIGDWNGSNTEDHVEVLDWDIGTTEGGSSGSPLFDQDHRVLGQLHGGNAACGNDGSDSYGWLNTSWEGGGTPSTRLKDWLDPINSGLMTIPGRSCNFVIIPDNSLAQICTPDDAIYQLTVSEIFVNNVDVTIENLPSGLIATLSNNNPAPGEIINLTISNTESLPFGVYAFSINGSDGIETSITNLTLIIFDDIPTMTSLVTPIDMSTGNSLIPNFEWESSSASTYEIEVATDINFNDVVASNSMITSETFSTNSTLESETTYFWRVRGNNTCGTGDWSNTQSFTTAVIDCNETMALDTPIDIDDGPSNTIVSTLDFPFNGIISDLNVINLEGTHSWLSDLTFTLESPAGTSVILISSACGDNVNFDINFDDQIIGSIPCPYSDGGTYPPTSLLSIFNGENAQGAWTLIVEDDGGGDGGSLNSWGLEICTIPSNVVDITPSQTNFTLCAGESSNFDIFIGGGFDTSPQLETIEGENGINLIFSSSNPTPGSTVNVSLEVDSSVLEGIYSIDFSASDGSNLITKTIIINVLSLPASSILNLPANGSSNISTSPTLTWNNPGGYSNLNLMISLDPNFMTDIVVNEDLPSNDFQYSHSDNLIGETVYYWQITGTNQCGSTVSNPFSFETEMSTGIEDIRAQNIKILPNPTQGDITINFLHPIDANIEGEIYHINGKLLDVFKIPLGRQTHNLDLSNFPRGIYIVKMKHPDFNSAKKIILN